jgi:hypothetical protein
MDNGAEMETNVDVKLMDTILFLFAGAVQDHIISQGISHNLAGDLT